MEVAYIEHPENFGIIKNSSLTFKSDTLPYQSVKHLYKYIMLSVGIQFVF